MKSFLAVFALILVLSGPAQARDLNGAIHHAFDVILREEMRNGNPYTGFPIVAPWIVPQIAVSWKFGHLVELDGEMRNFRLDGLDGFIISDVRLSLLTMRFVFDFVWPQVLATGWYNLNGRFGGLIPIFGQGNFRVDPRNFRASGFAQVRLHPLSQTLNVTNMECRLNLQTLNLDIQGILGGGDLSNVINAAAQDLIPSFLVTFEDAISDAIRDFLLPRINPFLNNLTIDDILNI